MHNKVIKSMNNVAPIVTPDFEPGSRASKNQDGFRVLARNDKGISIYFLNTARRCAIVAFFILVATVHAHDLVAPNALAVSAVDELRNFKADRMRFETDNALFLQTIDQELAVLKRTYKSESVDLNNTAVSQIAPTISQFIVGAIAKVAELAGIEKPAVRLFLGGVQNRQKESEKRLRRRCGVPERRGIQ